MKNSISVLFGLSLFIISFTAFSQSADIGLIELEAPVTGCGLTSNETVTVKLSNYGSSAHDSIPLAYRLLNGFITTDTLISSINPGDTISFSFSLVISSFVCLSY